MLLQRDTGVFPVDELAARYGLGRETFYVWKRRGKSDEERWFNERSRAPDSYLHATTDEKMLQYRARGRAVGMTVLGYLLTDTVAAK